MTDLDAVVIGAGVIGLAVARALANEGREVVILERESGIGECASSRNSEVIHAGIYNPPHMWKTRLCVSGRALVYEYLRNRNLPHRRLGKLIVATQQSQIAGLKRLMWQAQVNGVTGLSWITSDRLAEMEPEVSGVAAIHSSETGIVDSHLLMQSLLGDVEAKGGQLIRQTAVDAVRLDENDISIRLSSGEKYSAHSVVNAAGEGALKLLDCFDIPKPIRLYRAKGNYFSYSGTRPFNHLIYPMPEPGGLGIHATLDLAGRVRFGPDVDLQSVGQLEVNMDRKAGFISTIQRYYPNLDIDRLYPDYAGVRVKLNPPELPSDFSIQGPHWHGVKGLVNLFGIESPGLTSCLAIAQTVCAMLD